MRSRRRNICCAAAASALALSGCRPAAQGPTAEQRALVAHGLSDGQLAKLKASFDPAGLAIAERHDPILRQPDLWDRPAGWARLDLRDPPDLGFSGVTGPEAEAINALIPAAPAPIAPMKPFVLKAAAEDRGRALQCLAQAVYYEAGGQPLAGQEAIAQVVLNRVRHPAYPKSVCGVVFEGAAKPSGCQFSFTCDGSLARPVIPSVWNEALAVARRALSGFVFKPVGPATHYHAVYVAPYWAPSLVKLAQVGAHIFYRWTGPWGEPRAFTGRYAGHEAELPAQVLASAGPQVGPGGMRASAAAVPAPPVLRKVTLAEAGESRTYTVADPAAPGAAGREAGVLQTGRRKPTPDEVKRINDSLAAMAKQLEPTQDGKAP